MAAEDGDDETTAEAPSREAMVASVRPSGKPLREVAIGLYGREREDAGGHADGWMRSTLRPPARRAVDMGPSGDGTGPRRFGRRSAWAGRSVAEGDTPAWGQ